MRIEPEEEGEEDKGRHFAGPPADPPSLVRQVYERLVEDQLRASGVQQDDSVLRDMAHVRAESIILTMV